MSLPPTALNITQLEVQELTINRLNLPSFHLELLQAALWLLVLLLLASIGMHLRRQCSSRIKQRSSLLTVEDRVFNTPH